MLEDMGRGIPESTMDWAETCLATFREQSIPEREKTPMIAVIVFMGIYYGVRKELERAFVAFPATFTYENVEFVTRQFVMSECMRRYNLDTMMMRITNSACMSKRYYMGRTRLIVSFLVLPYSTPRDAQTMTVHFMSNEPSPSETDEDEKEEEEEEERADEAFSS